MKHKKYVLPLCVVVIVAVIIGIIIWAGHNPKGPQVISGRVTHISNECNSDGTCSITLDNSKVIVTGCGLTADSADCAVYDQSQLHIGQQIDATVVPTVNGWYDLACDSCGIRTNGR